MADSTISPLVRRLAAIDAEMDALGRERDEIATTLKVLERYGVKVAPTREEGTDKGEVTRAPATEHSSAETPDGDSKDQGAPRPAGIPTVFEMASMLLKEAPGHQLTMDEMRKQIEDRWWAGVSRNAIAPSVYKFAKQGRLRQVDVGTFSLPGESEAAASEKTETESAEPALGFLDSNHAGLRQ